MPLQSNVDVPPATGKLGVLLPGMGAVGTTFIAGCLAIRKGLAKPIGSLTQMGTIRIGPRTDDNVPLIRDYVPLATLDDLVFGGWDVFEDDAYVAASRAGVLEGHLLEQLGDELRAIKPMTAVFEQAYVKNLHGNHIKPETSKWEQAQALDDDINRFAEANGCDRLVAVWCGSTEVYREPTAVHETLAAFEKDCICAPGLPVCMCGGNHRQLKKVLRKPGLPTQAEMDRNPRARSAKLRVTEKV